MSPSRCGGLFWPNLLPGRSRGSKPYLLSPGPQLGRDNDPGIVAWSLDHHVLSVPVYQGPNYGGFIYKSHKAMLDKYQEFHMTPDEATSDTSFKHSGGGDVPISPSEGLMHGDTRPKPLNQSPTTSETFLKQWSPVHDQHFRSLNLLHCDWPIINYRTDLTGNVVRAIEADYQLNKTLEREARARHSIRQVIADHFFLVQNDYDTVRLGSRPKVGYPSPSTMREIQEVFSARDEATEADTQTMGSDVVSVDEARNLSKAHKTRLQHYPDRFSVTAAIMVTLPIRPDELPDRVANILRNLAFFEPSDSHSSDGSMQLQLPLLLIKDELDPEENGFPQVSTRNEQRIATASAAWFLAHLGIKDFPVFGLVTCGEKGYLSQSWLSEKQNCCYVADYNIQKGPFDIGSGNSRYNTFLSKLTDHARELERRFQTVKQEMFERANDEKASPLRWSAHAQLTEYKEADWAI